MLRSSRVRIAILVSILTTSLQAQANDCGADLAGAGGSCGPDGVLDPNDNFYFLDCFAMQADPCGGPLDVCDLNCDGIVNNADFAVINCISAGGTEEQCCGNCTYYFGLLHSPVGQATLTPGMDGSLVISNIGSSGEDGVSVDVGDANGLAIQIPDVVDPATAPVGACVSIYADYGQLGFTAMNFENADGKRRVTVDFSAIGTEMRTVEAFCQGVSVAHVMHSGPWDLEVEPQVIAGQWCEYCCDGSKDFPADGTATYYLYWKPTLPGDG